MADWMSVEEAAEWSGYAAEQIRRLIRSQDITAQKKGSMWWVDKQSLATYVKEAKRSKDKRKGPGREHNTDPAPQPPPSTPTIGFNLAVAYDLLIEAYLRTQLESAQNQNLKQGTEDNRDEKPV